MRDTLAFLSKTDFPKIYKRAVKIVQANITRKCNQTCVHCHVNASPKRHEMMSDEVIALLFRYVTAKDIGILDLTGGAPELHPAFCDIVKQAKNLGLHVIDRCNLTILRQPGQQNLGQFLADHEVEIIASLPCYLEKNVDKQRGKGVFAESIAACRQLNQLGYGLPGEEKLRLSLVYNPQEAVLPPDQTALELAYREILYEEYGIQFTRLLALANMPVKRFGSILLSKGQLAEYLLLLKNSFVADNLNKVMCRELLSIDWRGYTYDCDFNQMLDIPLRDSKTHTHLRDLLMTDLPGERISVREHCYGCTSGQGSSCAGALQGA